MPSAFTAIPDGSVTSPGRFTAAAVHVGLKSDGALDVALLVSTTSCATAGVFTRNALRAAPVIYDADLLSERPGRIRAVAMNARVANACTGAPGLEAARAMARFAEEAAGLPPRTALVLSTGVIGLPLPIDKVGGGETVVRRRHRCCPRDHDDRHATQALRRPPGGRHRYHDRWNRQRHRHDPSRHGHSARRDHDRRGVGAGRAGAIPATRSRPDV